MFTETLEEKLADYGNDDNLASAEGTLTANNKTDEDEATVFLEVKEDEDSETVTATVKHPDGEWKGTFHTNQNSHEELAQVICDEYDYWLNN